MVEIHWENVITTVAQVLVVIVGIASVVAIGECEGTPGRCPRCGVARRTGLPCNCPDASRSSGPDPGGGP